MRGVCSCEGTCSTMLSSTVRPLGRQRYMTAVRTSARGNLVEAGQVTTAAARLAELFRDRPVLTLERSALEETRPDSELWQRGPFRAEIMPDLPEISKWQDLTAKIFRRSTPAPQVPSEQQQTMATGVAQGTHRWFIQTVAAQASSQASVQQRLEQCCNASQNSSQQSPHALLMLSGSHPFRQLPFAHRWMTNSMQMLQLAHQMRDEGIIPQRIAFWAVENPLTNHADRLKRKIDAGAEVIITQPPILWEQFETWMNEVQRCQILAGVKLVVGCPVVSSAGNMRFWLHLCQAAGLQGAEAAVQGFSAAAQAGKEASTEYCHRYNTELMRKVLEYPDVAGLHVMPLTKKARSLTMPMLQSLGL